MVPRVSQAVPGEGEEGPRLHAEKRGVLRVKNVDSLVQPYHHTFRKARGTLLRYGTTVVASAGALLLTLVLTPWTEGSPFPIFLAAVMLSTWFGGLGPGLLSTVLGVLASIYFFQAPFYSLTVTTLTGGVRLIVFVLVALLISSLHAALREAWGRAETARAVAEAATLETRQALGVRDEFLASASHELRTPLSHIKGFVSTLRQTDVEWEEATRQEFLSEIERETDRLAKLIGDLLDMSRLESGGPEKTERVLAAPADLVAAGLDRVRGLLEDHPLHIDISASLPFILVDPTQLERVIANLVENAAKYSGPGATITITATVDADELELRVADQGPGIPHQDLEHIFDRFVRLKTPGRTVPGTGLGLAICRRLVEAHDGAIWAESCPRGARFHVKLPLAAAQPEGHDAAPDDPGR
jgi:K+-sensing histidine kinase KdpD